MKTDLTRRRLLQGLAAVAPLGQVRPGWAREPSVRPHYVVTILLAGAYDSVLTVDPKLEGGKGIEPGYEANSRVQGTSRLYGPLFKPLMAHEADLCLVHGVRSDTVGHVNGYVQLARGRIDCAPSHPYFADMLGAVLAGDASIPHLSLQDAVTLTEPLSPRARRSEAIHISSGDLESALGAAGTERSLSPPWTRAVNEAAYAEGDARFGADSPNAQSYRQLVRKSELLGQLLADVPRQSPYSRDSTLGDRLHIALHALAHNHARCVSVSTSPVLLDSHVDNVNYQTQRLTPVLSDIAAFLTALKERRNAFGSLFEQTTVVIGSEFGRFPKFNTARGKDHWPENTWMLFGKGIRRSPGGLTVGSTDERFRGAAIDFKSGSAVSGDRRPLLLDNLFATVLKVAGGHPKAAGYGKDAVVECLLAS
jgi:hypothetical protein